MTTTTMMMTMMTVVVMQDKTDKCYRRSSNSGLG